MPDFQEPAPPGFWPTGFAPAGFFADVAAPDFALVAGFDPFDVLGFWPGGSLPPSFFTPTGLVEFPAELADAVELGLLGLTTPAGGPLAWAGAGLAPNGVGLPYASYNEPAEEDSILNAAGDRHARGGFEVQVFAAGKAEARRLGNVVAAALVAAGDSGGLRFTAGRLAYFHATGRATAMDPDPAPGGGPVWVETRQFEFRYSYRLPNT